MSPGRFSPASSSPSLAHPVKFNQLTLTTGAGKTTLLNYLSGRDIGENLHKEGTIFLNGVDTSKLRKTKLSHFSAFIQQDDVMFMSLTVRECIEFAAKLKLSGSYA